MNSDDIRAKFVRYFEQQGHLHLPSSSLVVHGDPSVLLTTAGMQQFKPYYLDPSKAPARRLVTIQRCMRTSDIDEVGDSTHHSFFEMLGNFAFGKLEDGGYFKKEAIAFGYEFVTRELGIPAGRIWTTTWKGEPGLPADAEAVALWRALGIPAERIVPLNRKPDGSRENFWGPTGDSGPCGPCSEIHVDATGYCPLGAPDDQCGPEHGCGRLVEIWNLVFNQYYMEPDRSLRPLEHTGIDTGSGLERVAAFLQGVNSAYDTDLLKPIVDAAVAVLDAPYGEDPEITRALRIVVDHARAVTFLIADGVFPSNEARGYVARRILRRAVRYGRQLGRSEPFLVRLAQATIDRMAPFYPHLRDRQAVIEQTIAQEEARFSETLNAGLELLSNELQRLEQAGDRVLSGSVAFRLYDTFGFPFELTRETAAMRGIEVDEATFRAELQARQEQSRRGSRFAGGAPVDLPHVSVRFEGYDHLAIEGARVVQVRQGGERVSAAEPSDDEVWVILDRTPFYAERGGQVGDTGRLVGPHGEMLVTTTQAPVDETVVHIGRVIRGHIAQGDQVTAEVDVAARRATMRHHTATHLLHAALRAELGPHVYQSGSLVAPDRLRFDFTHGQPLTAQQRRAIQERISEVIRRNLEVEVDLMSLEQATRSGALALFDEKYGDRVRVVSIGDVSRELCGGTHVARTGDIGTFVLAGESSIGSGLRRIEALAGAAADAYVAEQAAVLDRAAALLGVQWSGVPARLEQLQAQLAEERRRREAAERRASQQGLASLPAQAEEVAGKKETFLLLAAEVDPQSAPTLERLREVADWLRDRFNRPSVLLLGVPVDGRVHLLATVSKELVAQGLHAGNLIREIAPVVGGRGGGRAELAQGGGNDPARLAAALERGRQIARQQAAAT